MTRRPAGLIRKFRLTLADEQGTTLAAWTLLTPWDADDHTADFGLPFTLLGRAVLADEIARAADVPPEQPAPTDTRGLATGLRTPT